jgi:hypothetical protein
MDNYKKFGVFAGQIFMGLGFSVVGWLAGLISYNVVAAANGTYVDLTGTFLNIGALIGWCIGLLTGICFDGYKFLKQNVRQNEFLKFLFISVIGISVGLFGLSFVIRISSSLGLSDVMAIFLAVALFLIGILLGSILVLTRDTNQT